MVPTSLQSAFGPVALVPLGTTHVELASQTLAMSVGAAFFTFFVLFALGSLAVQLVLVWWTYTDAKQHTQQSPELWALVVLVAPVMGLLLYLLVGRGEQTL